MRVVICVDEKGGIVFNNRRQSRDRILIEDLRKTVGSECLVVSPYTAKLFEEHWPGLKICDNPLVHAGDQDFCFVELVGISEYKNKISELTIYNWNRHYPADKVLDLRPEDIGLTLKESYDFVGSSHDKITKEIYG